LFVFVFFLSFKKKTIYCLFFTTGEQVSASEADTLLLLALEKFPKTALLNLPLNDIIALHQVRETLSDLIKLIIEMFFPLIETPDALSSGVIPPKSERTLPFTLSHIISVSLKSPSALKIIQKEVCLFVSFCLFLFVVFFFGKFSYCWKKKDQNENALCT